MSTGLVVRLVAQAGVFFGWLLGRLHVGESWCWALTFVVGTHSQKHPAAPWAYGNTSSAPWLLQAAGACGDLSLSLASPVPWGDCGKEAAAADEEATRWPRSG